MNTTRIYLIKRRRTLPSGKSASFYVLRWYGTDGKLYSESLGRCDKTKQRDAEQARRDKETAIGCGKIRRDRPRRMTLADYFTMDRQGIAGDVRGSTLIEYDLATAKAKAALGNGFLLTEVGWAEIGRIKTYMIDPPKPAMPTEGGKPVKVKAAASAATVRKTLSTLRASFNRAMKQGLLNANPFADMGLPNVEGKAKRIFTTAEVAALVTAAGPDIWWQSFIKLAATCGLRRDEMLNLLWTDIDMAKGTVTVQRKTADSIQVGALTFRTWEWSAKAKSSYRTVPLPQDTVDYLKRLRMRMGASPFAFIDAKRLTLLQRHIVNGKLPPKFDMIPNLLRDFVVIQKHAAVGAIGCVHDLRRTYCTWMADVVPMHVLREWAGHSDIATTATYYLGVGDGMADRARKALSAAMIA